MLRHIRYDAIGLLHGSQGFRGHSVVDVCFASSYVSWIQLKHGSCSGCRFLGGGWLVKVADRLAQAAFSSSGLGFTLRSGS